MEKMKEIQIINAKEHNLKNVSVNIPYYQLSVVTGNSGSGKSSLVYDTIYAYSQREFMGIVNDNDMSIMARPNVDQILHLCPVISLAQTSYNHNPRSTVGTVTDIGTIIQSIFVTVLNSNSPNSVSKSDFLFNLPGSWCNCCKGLGVKYYVDIDKLIPDPKMSLKHGAIAIFKGTESSQEISKLQSICDFLNIDPDLPFADLTEQQKNDLLFFNEKRENLFCTFKNKKKRTKKCSFEFSGVASELQHKIDCADNSSELERLSKFASLKKCDCCNGNRLNEKILSFKICGYNYGEVYRLSFDLLSDWMEKVLSFYADKDYIETLEYYSNMYEKKYRMLKNLKVSYLSCDRSIPTLSNGEYQRIRIANQLSCGLSELLYIFDEPCKGLHFKDIDSIINVSKEIINSGNTVLAIEHNVSFLKAADKIYVMGPGAGPDGGNIISIGKYSDIYNDGTNEIRNHKIRKSNEYIKIINAQKHNICGLDFEIPIGSLTIVSGVSGSGKSTLINKILYPSVSNNRPICCQVLEYDKAVTKTYLINHLPIGKNSRSSVASYLGISAHIKKMFANKSKEIGLMFRENDFSLNCTGGRCEKCMGTGKISFDVPYMSRVFSICPECKGVKYIEDVLEVKINGLSISDVMDLSIEDSYELFDSSSVKKKIKVLIEMGLGYLKIGQQTQLLSGGEAQRLKIAKILGERINKGSLLLIDEPTLGLSDKDINNVSKIINDIVDAGNTVICIEHNLKFILNNADYILDLGEKGGCDCSQVTDMGWIDEVLNNHRASIFNIE